ncbi:MAG: dTDP-4-oxo-6-deoxy-D-allose reductase [Promethearchaeota archaeon]|nr:MAG: dTDP-4-oxo-6-deoxy-D-allose reductase [Candidatus Lokiarchaeota archaeon]
MIDTDIHLKGHKMRALVAGAGGFIGGHLVKSLLDDGYEVLGVDIKPIEDWHQVHDNSLNIYNTDLRSIYYCNEVTKNIDECYNLACDMGGMGFIENNKAQCMISVLINTHLLISGTTNGVSKHFFSSSACVYAADKQIKDGYDVSPLKESDAYPAMPEDGYGWEKLFSERMCRHFTEDFNLDTRVARFHNVYGPYGTWTGGREKAPAAICRKVIEAKKNGTNEIEIWGDGNQARTFTYITDCIYGIRQLMKLEKNNPIEPINIGSSELVTINDLVSIVEEIAGITLDRNYILDAPKGVPGRSSNNNLIKEKLGWEPSVSLKQGMEETYKWIEQEYDRNTL